MITELGTFSRYEPEGGPDGLLHFRNEDGNDWHQMSFAMGEWTSRGVFLGAAAGVFVSLDDGVVRHVEADPSRIVPDGRLVLMVDADPADIAAGMLFDGQSFNEAPPPPVPPKRYSKKALFEAMTDDEVATFESVEGQQSAKDRRVFREATELNEADPSYPQFLGLMNSVYDEARTAELLATAVL